MIGQERNAGELAKYTTRYSSSPLWRLGVSPNEVEGEGWHEASITYDGYPAQASYHYGATPAEYQTVDLGWTGMWVELRQPLVGDPATRLENRPATILESVRLVEAIARTTQENGWNNPDKIKAIVYPRSRVDAVTAKTLADCALEHVWDLIVHGSMTADVSDALAARYRDAQWRISNPTSLDEQRPLLSSETRDSGGLVHVVQRPPWLGDYQSGNRRSLANPSGR